MRSTFHGVVGAEYQITIPKNRGPKTVSLSSGKVRFTAGSVETMALGEGDIAALYAAFPGVRVRPTAAPAEEAPQEARQEPQEAPEEAPPSIDATQAPEEQESPKPSKKKGKGEDGQG